ncbi:MAG TPA: IS4 family transposase [Parachlamydiaceae bacterium]|nr:IS4 family transposase [Parachlamydiaceae bacterium]
MQVTKILHQLLDATIHKTRIKSLLPIIQAIIVSKQLRLTQLGRGLETSGKERSGIRRVDRLLANRYYQEKAIDIYKATTQIVLGNQGRPIILVDWTGLPNSQNTTENGEYCALRASLISEGRSITLYEESHSKKKENNDEVHQEFLKKLKSILPRGCRPYVITDAGFKNPWFRAVLALGWDYIGRVRGKVTYDMGNGFEPIKNLHEKASTIPKSLGSLLLAKENSLKTNCYIYKHKLRGRKKLTKAGKIAQSNVSKKTSTAYREPWVLVSSLSGFSAVSRVIKTYKYRMTIEGSFRDAKSTEFGFSLNENKTIKSARYRVWLMISTLAYLIAWIIGYAAEKQELHYDFQANTYKHRRVLSFFYLGCQIVRKKIDITIQLKEIQQTAWDELAWNILC